MLTDVAAFHYRPLGLNGFSVVCHYVLSVVVVRKPEKIT